MIKLKVLRVPLWVENLHWQSPDDQSFRDEVKRNGYRIWKTGPGKRDGWYFCRHRLISWIIFKEHRIFSESLPDEFVRQLRTLDRKPPPANAIPAMKLLIASNCLPDECHESLKRYYYDTREIGLR